MAETRIEHDSMGDIAVPADKLWGAQTQRSLHHFDFPAGERMPLELVHAHLLVKRACAAVNMELGVLAPDKGKAIIQAADEALKG
jgi:fumarate hydratase, class II